MKRSSPPARRTPLPNATIRWLRPDEPDPDGEPKRYDRAGAQVLRWKVGKRQYVERMARTPGGELVRLRPLRQKRLDPAIVKDLYEQGRTTTEVAAILGCDAGAVSRVLRRAGGTARSWTSYGPPFDPKEAVRLYVEEHQGTKAVARHLGVSPQRVTAALREARVVRRPGRPTRSKAGPTYETEFEKIRPLVRQRSRGECEARATPRCRGKATHVHHRKLRSQGGPNTLANLLDVCIACHAAIHNGGRRSYEQGFLVRSTDSPEDIPVQPLSVP